MERRAADVIEAITNSDIKYDVEEEVWYTGMVGEPHLFCAFARRLVVDKNWAEYLCSE